MTRFRALALVLAAVAVTLLLTGCARFTPTFVDEGASYANESALALLERQSIGELADKPTTEAEELRHQSLVALRRMEGNAADAAGIITRTFPATAPAVPFYIERAEYEGQAAWLVVEAIGKSGGKFADKRIWVLSSDGDVLLSGTR